jgi:hypothetical protein
MAVSVAGRDIDQPLGSVLYHQDFELPVDASEDHQAEGEHDGAEHLLAALAGGHRVYTRRHLHRLLFILNGRELGFMLEQVRELIDLSDWPDRPCEEARLIAERHLAQVNTKLTQLRLIKAALAKLAGDCKTCCPGSQAPDCTIIAALARPRLADAFAGAQPGA